MKKLLLTLGAVASVAAPVAAVVACSSDSKDVTFKDYLGSLTTKDITENFSKDYGVLALATSELAEELLTGNGTNDALGSLKVLEFSLDGKKGTFDFTTDKFLHNGLEKTPTYTITTAATDSSNGEFDGYLAEDTPSNEGDSTKILLINKDKGLVLNTAWVKELKALELTAHNTDTKGKDAELSTASKNISNHIRKAEDKIRYAIRMAIAAKTDLHVNASGTWVVSPVTYI